jgi:hypothetical protein
VRVTDLDSFIRHWGLEQVDVVKVDVESLEEEVILGMPEILARYRPVIFLEVLPHEARNELSAQLLEMDYKLYYLTFGGPLSERLLASTAPSIDHAHTPVNHLACPTEKVPPWLRSST